MSETSVERAFAILETFGKEQRPLSLKELAEYCRMPASTCHSLVHTLLKRSYLYQTGKRKNVYPTRRIYDLGATIVAHDQILQRLDPVMEDLRDSTRETVILGKRQGDEVVYLEVLESPEVIRYSARPGDTKPLASTCIGKAMLAELGHDEAKQWLQNNPPRRATPNTITSIKSLLADLTKGRDAGFYMTHGENVADVTALAVPFRLNNEQLAIAVAGPSHRIDANLSKIARLLRKTQSSLLEQEHYEHV